MINLRIFNVALNAFAIYAHGERLRKHQESIKDSIQNRLIEKSVDDIQKRLIEKLEASRVSDDPCNGSCRYGQKCIYDPSHDRHPKPGPGKRSLQLDALPLPYWRCLFPCAEVCNWEGLNCDIIGNDPPAYPLVWWELEQTPCFQVELDQFSNYFFIRTKCACPNRDYSVSEPCPEGNGAHLSNCIQGWLVQEPEINFGNMDNVLLGYVKATGFEEDVDYQGTISNSRVCRTEGHDIEFGGEECPAIVTNNRFDHFEMHDDLQFEEGTTVKDNTFGTVNINDKLRITDEDGSYTTVIEDNVFGDITVGDKCKSDATSPLPTISGNTCDVLGGTPDDCDDPPFSPGFSCF